MKPILEECVDVLEEISHGLWGYSISNRPHIKFNFAQQTKRAQPKGLVLGRLSGPRMSRLDRPRTSGLGRPKN